MNDEKNKTISCHTLLIENREKLSLTGVTDVDSFDDTLITAYTEDSRLTVTGSLLHISKLNIDEGELWVEGQIDAISYSENNAVKAGIFGKIFR